MGKVKYKICSICGKEYPANRKFFKRNSDDTLHDECRFCNEEEKEEKRKEEWKDGLLRCHICNEYLPIDNFGFSDHYPYRDNHDARCRKCRTKQNNDRKKKYSESESLNKILQMRFLAARNRSKKQNIPFNITKKYLKELWDKQNGVCAISGLKMTFDHCNGRTPTNVSIDQINHKNGYTVDNIQLVCMAVNQMKSDMAMEDLYKFCNAIIENKKGKEKGLNEENII